MHLRRLLIIIVLSIGVLVATASAASAASFVWTGAGADTEWSTLGNWYDETAGATATVLPGSADDVEFPSPMAPGQVLVTGINSAITVRSLTVEAASTTGVLQPSFSGSGSLSPTTSSSITGGSFNHVGLTYPAGAGLHLIVPDGLTYTQVDEASVTIDAGATLKTSGFRSTSSGTLLNSGTLDLSAGTAAFEGVRALNSGAMALGTGGGATFTTSAGYLELHPGGSFTGTGTVSGRGVDLYANVVLPTGVTLIATGNFYATQYTLTGGGTFELQGAAHGAVDTSVNTVLSSAASLIPGVGLSIGPVVLRGPTRVISRVGISNQTVINHGTMTFGHLGNAGGLRAVGGFNVLRNETGGTIVSAPHTGPDDNYLQVAQIHNRGAFNVRATLLSDEDPGTRPYFNQQEGGSTTIEGVALRGFELGIFKGSITAWSTATETFHGTLTVTTGATLTIPTVDPGVTSLTVTDGVTIGSGTLDVGIDSATRYSRLVGGGTGVTHNGNTTYRRAPGFTPAATDTFPFLVATSGSASNVLSSTVRRNAATPASSAYFVRSYTPTQVSLVPRFTTVTAVGTLQAGNAVVISGSGFIPGETVTVRIDASAPGDVAQGSGVADAGGVLAVPVTLPASTPGTGTATVRASGAKSEAEVAQQLAFAAAPVTVTPPLKKPTLGSVPRGTTLASVRTVGLVSTVTVPAAGTVKSTLTIPAAVAKSIGLLPKSSKRRTPVTIGTVTVKVAKAGTVKVTTKLTRAARTALAKPASVKVTQTVTVRVGATTTTIVRAITLKRPKPAKR